MSGDDRKRRARAAAMETLLVTMIAAKAKIPAETVDADKPFAEHGLDSAMAVGLVGELETRLGVHLAATLAWDYPTIAALSVYLAARAPDED